MTETANRPVGKRLGAERSATRMALIEATDQLVREEGYGAVTSRRLAEKAGLKHQLIYYYFNTLNDLLLEVFQRGSEREIAELELVLQSDQPLRALWAHNSDASSFSFMIEYTSMGAHHAPIRAALAAHAERVHAIEEAAIAGYLARRGLDIGIPSRALTAMISGMSRVLLIERAMGVSYGHAETQALVESWFARLETPSPQV